MTDSAYAATVFGTGNDSGSSGSSSATASATAANKVDSFETRIVSSFDNAPGSDNCPMICVVPLAVFTNSIDCGNTIRGCMSIDGGRRLLIIVADMKQVHLTTFI